ncbi:hypothetical protein [Candidatus Solirubrobacter pratensis]|uniref:hypothetical protein n=1 Tax=Candidatus Solirubrobacter pratensis TaxID=1298857 RepID=UPI00040F1528|nr:hypothetical protein [Candidatus Solirubrobacter pratensis]
MRIARAAGAAIAMTAASAAVSAPAQAGVLTKSATGCGDPEITQAFKPWGDSSSYKQVDDFETGADGWTLSGGAKVIAGDASPKIGTGADSRSLSLPAGSVAVSPPVCVGLSEPTLRFFSKKSSGLLSTLSVWVDVQTSLNVWVTLPIGVDLGGGWHPTLPYAVIANLLPLLPPDQTAVRFRFAPLLGGSWQIDDVYVDPRARS